MRVALNPLRHGNGRQVGHLLVALKHQLGDVVLKEGNDRAQRRGKDEREGRDQPQ